MRYFIVLLLILFGSKIICAGEQPLLKFIENKNQWPYDVHYMSGFYNGKIFLKNKGFVFDILNQDQLSKAKSNRLNENNHNMLINGHVYEVEFINANPEEITAQYQASSYYNFFLGNKKENWTGKVKAFKKVVYKQFYKNTDMVVYSEGNNIKYDFIVASGADPEQIKFEVKYAKAVSLNDGDIHIKTNAGSIIEKAPSAWQIINGIKKIVACRYNLTGSIISYNFPEGYDKTYELIIDPVVVACTFTGSSVACNGEASAYDEKRNGYTAGSVLSSAFPTTQGAYQTTWGGISDATINKYNTNGSQLLFSTFIGGNQMESSYCMNVRGNSIYLMGHTTSPDFAVSNNAFDTSYNGGEDIFFIKLDTSGSVLLASTFIGGTSDDGAAGAWKPSQFRNFEFVQDANENIYAASASSSTDFPVTTGAYASSLSGTYDAVIFKLDSSLSTLIWSTYLGGSTRDCANAIRLDGSGGIYCTGTTESNNFPTTAGAFSSTSPGGNSDCFVAHISGNGSTLLSSTYIGTAGIDYGYLIETGENNEVYIYSLLLNNNAGSFLPSNNTYYVPNGRNFIYKLDASLTQVLFQTRFGPTINPNVSSDFYLVPAVFQLDSCGNIYIAGDAAKNFITTPDAIKQSTTNYDLYFCVLSPDAASIRFGSYYGGPFSEWATFGICKIDFKGTIYYSFNGNSNTPTTANGYSQSFISGSNANDHGFLKIDVGTFLSATSYSSQLNKGCSPYTISFTNQSGTNNISWLFADNPPATYTSNIATHTFENTGTYNVILIASDSSTCNKNDTLIQQVQVYSSPDKNLTDSVAVCINSNIKLDAGNPGLSYFWSNGESTQTIDVDLPGLYTATITNPGCSITDSSILYISSTNYPFIFPNIITPNNDGVNDFIDVQKFELTDCELIISDRWGRQVFQSSAPDAKWDGKVNGEVICGTYYFILKYKRDCLQTEQESTGFITVVK